MACPRNRGHSHKHYDTVRASKLATPPKITPLVSRQPRGCHGHSHGSPLKSNPFPSQPRPNRPLAAASRRPGPWYTPEAHGWPGSPARSPARLPTGAASLPKDPPVAPRKGPQPRQAQSPSSCSERQTQSPLGPSRSHQGRRKPQGQRRCQPPRANGPPSCGLVEDGRHLADSAPEEARAARPLRRWGTFLARP